MKKLYILPTQHFDIIWRKSTPHYQDVRSRVIKKSLEFLDKYPEYRFFLDQAEVIREFIELNPDYRDKIIAAIRSGRFEICGGGMTLVDSNMVLGESIVRNIMYGRQWFKENAGIEVTSGSYVDTFGMCGQLPQIMEKVGDRFFISGRTPGGEGKYQYGDYGCFIWEGINGSKALSDISALGKISWDGIAGFYGYSVMEGFDADYQKIGDDFDIAMKNIRTGIEDLLKLPEDVISVNYSGEEHTPSEALPILVKEFNEKSDSTYQINISTPSEFYSKIDKSKVPVISGEFNPTLTGCYTTRIEIKRNVRKAENALLTAERLMVIADAIGTDKSFMDLKDAWKDLHYAQFHDAICGCHIDETYPILTNKLADALKIAKAAQSELSKAISDNILLKNNSAVLFNTLEFPRKSVVALPGVKDAAVVDQDGIAVPSYNDENNTYFLANLPAMGYASYKIADEPKVEYSTQVTGDSFETDRYSVKIGSDRLYITDKLLNTRIDTDDIPMANVVYAEDSGNLWVERLTGKEVTEKAGKIEFVGATENPLFISVIYMGRITKDDLGENAWEGADSVEWKKEYLFYKDMNPVDLKFTLNWSGKNSTVFLRYPCKFVSAKGESYAEVPFASQKRIPYTSDYEKYQGGTWPALNTIDFSDQKRGLTIANDGTPGYIIKDQMLQVAMVRSGSDWIIPYFPFQPEEGSFDGGVHEYNISILPHEGNYYTSEAFRLGLELNNRIVVNISDEHDGNLNAFESFMSISKPNIILSALKPSEDGTGYAMRLYELEGMETDVAVKPAFDYTKTVETNLLETVEESEVDLSDLKFKPFEIKTVKIVK